MTPKIACLLTSPTFVGGTETALYNAYYGFQDLDVDVQAYAVRLSARSRWSNQALDYATPVSHQELLPILSEYDGVVLSNTYFPDKYVPRVISDPALKHVKLTTGWHGNDVMKTMLEAHEIVKRSPMWSGKYVRFWENPLEDPDVQWVDSVLPYIYQPPKLMRMPTKARHYDLGFVGRVDPRKGAFGFAVAAATLAEQSAEGLRVLIAGAPNDLPGGPLIHTIRKMLEERGWILIKGGEKMKSTWTLRFNESTIHYSGGFQYDEVPTILNRVKVYVNMTATRASRNHFEYTTLEAFNAGCAVIAPDDVPKTMYDAKPEFIPAAMSAVNVLRNGRPIFNDMTKSAPVTYAPMVDCMRDALDLAKSRNAFWQEKNREVILQAHDATRAASAYLKALDL
ncbi:hypothetical protein PP301_gp054 [Gordonia phage GMA2]|uniref:Glycosyl transferase family 1 domain-containing protein n=1 Tax=Gordonia phage GMA2 TaxID=1647283 RepID=A0A0K0N775_9CAUD|nr:hypothetical protein PP301_gp054 [Gordonia phage GMA2]AKJ72592.1 hypothetical protein GMA2_54 [Gordonia phage GMA2]